MNAEDAARRLSFDRDPESYDLGRPQYPTPAFDDLFMYLSQQAPVDEPTVLEIGPGTGQATAALLKRGAAVTAVEIGAHLAAFLRNKFASRSDLKVITGAFEDIELPDHAFDLVLAATAFKWVDPEVRTVKAHRILRPGGVLATLSTIQIASELDRGFFDRTFSIYQRYRPNEPWTHAPTELEATPPEYAELRSSSLFDDVQLNRYRWDHTYTAETYEQLLRSYSDIQTMPAPSRDGLIADLRRVIDAEFDSTIVRPLVIALTLARRPV